MQSPASQPTGPWIFRVQVDHEPRCPGCAEFLQACVVEFRNGWAWCQPCIMMGLHTEPWIAAVLEGEPMRDCKTVLHGLTFYTPALPASQVQTAYEWYEQSEGTKWISETEDQEDGLYVLTPDGEHLLTELNTKDLLQVETDLKRARARRKSRSPRNEASSSRGPAPGGGLLPLPP